MKAGDIAIQGPGPHKQYLGDGTDFTVTGTNFTLTRAIAVPYQTSDGSWRLRGNITGTYTGSPISDILNISGVVFKNVAVAFQSIDVTSSSVSGERARTDPNTGDILWDTATGISFLGLSFDVELESKPSWAD